MRAVRFGIAAAAGLLEAGIAVALLASSDRAGTPWLTGAFAVTAGMSFVAAGLVALWRRPENSTGLLLAATGYLWFGAALGESNNEWVFTFGFVFGNAALVAFAAAILAYPDGTLTRVEGLVVGVAGATAIGANLLGALVVEEYDGCDGCPGSAIAITDRPDLERAIDLAATLIIAPLLVVITVILVRRWRAASPAQRRLYRPVYLACVIAAGLLAVAVPLETVNQTAGDVVWLGFLVAFAAVPLTFLWGVLRSRRERASAAGLLLTLDAGTPLREALARALHDPSLQVAYRLDEPARWVDSDGVHVPDPAASPGRSVTMVDREGVRVAALTHDQALDDEPGLVESVSAAAALFLHNERLQAALRSQYAYLRTITNTAPSLLVSMEPSGTIRELNLAALRATGRDRREAVTGRSFWDVFVDPAERDDVRARFAAAAPAFGPGEYENTFTNARGERRVIAWDSAPVVAHDGTVVSLVTAGLDITERTQRELELQQQREDLVTTGQRLAAVIESSPSAIVEVDLDGVVQRWNPSAERMFGYTEAETIGKGVPNVPLVPEDKLDELAMLFERVRAGKSYWGFESQRIRRDGTRFDVEIAAAPVRDAGGTIVGHMALFNDITDRKQKELELLRESEFLRTVADSIEGLLVNVDGDAVVVGHSVNKAFEHRLGWSEEEMLGRPVLDLFPEAERAGALEAIRAAVAGADVAERESRWAGRDTRRIDVAWTATQVVSPSGEAQVVVSGTDITERNRQQEEIRASRARIMQAGDDARRRLERDLHDGAQQRLVALALTLRLAESKLRAGSSGVEEILAGARGELAYALDELRELARGIHPAVLTERGLAAAVESLVTRTPLPVDADLTEERLPAPIEAAAYFVVAEALTNVAKYAGATSAHVRVRADDGVVTVEVADDGVGGADPGAGTGLSGLADRVAALDGSLSVESPAGQGTRVIARLPVRDRARSL